MILTQRETDSIHAILWEIRSRAGSPKLPRHTIENLCNKASLILKKAKKARRKNRVTRLHFEIGDFDV